MQAVEADADGRAVLKVEVTAPPEGGQANAAVIRLLARRWGLTPGRFLLQSGAAARQKVLIIAGGGPDLLDKILKIEQTGS